MKNCLPILQTLAPGHPEAQNKIAIGIPASESNPRILSLAQQLQSSALRKLSEMSTGAMEVYIYIDYIRPAGETAHLKGMMV